MKSTICTEAGVVNIDTKTMGRVTLNGRDLLPHEAYLIGDELMRAAQQCIEETANLVGV